MEFRINVYLESKNKLFLTIINDSLSCRQIIDRCHKNLPEIGNKNILRLKNEYNQLIDLDTIIEPDDTLFLCSIKGGYKYSEPKTIIYTSNSPLDYIEAPFEYHARDKIINYIKSNFKDVTINYDRGTKTYFAEIKKEKTGLYFIYFIVISAVIMLLIKFLI